MHVLRKYGVATTINFPLSTAGTTDFAASFSHASGDTKIIKDEGAAANTTNGFVDETVGQYSIALTATEMQAARICVNIVDQGTKAWVDQCVIIETFGHPSAQYPTGITTGPLVLSTTIATLSSQTSWTLTAGSTVGAVYRNHVAQIRSASNPDNFATAVISAYIGASKTVTLLEDPGLFTMAVGDIVDIYFDGGLKSAAFNRQLTVTANAGASIDWAAVLNPTTTVNLSNTTIKTTQQVDVNTIKTQSVTCSAGVTVNTNVGTTQPINFTGTGASALAKSDMVDIAGSAVSETTSQIGVNVVKVSGDSGAADNEEAFFDGTGYAGGTIKLGVDIVSISGDATAADMLEAFFEGAFLAGSVNDASPTGASFIVDNAFSNSTDLYSDLVLVFTSGTLKGVSRKISTYTPLTRTMGFSDSNFPASPSNGNTFLVIGYIET